MDITTTPNSTASAIGAHPLTPVGRVTRRPMVPAGCGQDPRDDDQPEAAIVSALVFDEGVPSDQGEKRVVEHLHRPQDAGHEDGGGDLDEQQSLSGGHPSPPLLA